MKRHSATVSVYPIARLVANINATFDPLYLYAVLIFPSHTLSWFLTLPMAVPSGLLRICREVGSLPEAKSPLTNLDQTGSPTWGTLAVFGLGAWMVYTRE